MSPDLAAALARYATEPAARRFLLSRRFAAARADEAFAVGQTLAAAGHHRAAALWLARAHRLDAQSAQVAYRLGNALRMAGRVRVADGILDAVSRRHPAWAEPAHSLAWLRRGRGDAAGAAAALERWLVACGDDSRRLRSVSGFLQEMGMETRAERLLSASNRAATEPDLLAERGALLLKLGRFDEAEKALREALGREPRLAGAWLRLAQVRRWREVSTSPAEAMREALARPGLDDSTRAAIGFALAKVADDLGEYRQAWDAAVEANRLRARSAHFDRPGWERYEAALPRVFTPDFYATGRQGGGGSPVFIVGMPRSGTTLLERRLGRNSRLVPAGEMEVVEQTGIELAGPAGYPDGLSSVPPETFEIVAGAWRQRLPAALPAAGDVIDKNPLNFLHLGLIVRLFPHARIVHCRRGPLDTLLSLWFQNFAHPRNDYAYRPDDLVWMYALYRRVMSFWESTLPVQIHAVDYERLVEDPEGELRALAGVLALPWEPAMARAGAEGAISTASLWQARQPVYRRSAGRWRNYEPWIGPLRDALARAGIAERA